MKKAFALALLVFGLFFFATAGAEEEQTPNPTPKPAANTGNDAVSFSDGSKLFGTLFMKGSTKLKLFDEQQKNYIDVAISDISLIEVKVEKATMEKVWRFKEEGSPEKIFTGEEYPLHHYMTTVTLVNGACFDTHCAAVLFLRNTTGDQQIFLLIKQAGTTTQKLSDLVYVSRIEFFDRRLTPGGGSIAVNVPADWKARQMVVVSWKTGTIFYSYAREGAMILSDLPPDHYDVFVMAEKRIVYCLSPFTPAGEAPGTGDGLDDLPEKKVDGETTKDGAGLTNEEKASLTKYIGTAEEFFELKEALDFGGNNKAVRSFVRQKRVNETSYGTEAKKITLWRYDLWFLHQLQTEWRIDKRAFLWRDYLPVGDMSALPKVTIDARLGGVDLRKAGTKFSVELK
ncbi:MAG: hypothetical protein WC712_12645 [Candidatus Brocadiia bacterium]